MWSENYGTIEELVAQEFDKRGPKPRNFLELGRELEVIFFYKKLLY